MDDTKKATGRSRGRPRRFDEQAAVRTAERLFHERGYDGVGVAELGSAIGIGAPSLYAAFGSKLGLFERVLDTYTRDSGAYLKTSLMRDGPVAEALPAMLAEAATVFTTSGQPRGCMVLSGTMNCTAPEVVALSQKRLDGARNLIRDRIARERPADADDLADLTMTLLSGLSARARDGESRGRLMAAARAAAAAYA